jgi:hypothetical protein
MVGFDHNDAPRNMTFFHLLKSYIHFIYTYITYFFLFRRSYRNYIRVMYQVLRNHYPINAILPDGDKITFNQYHELYRNLLNVNCDIENDIAFVDGIRFYGGKSKGDIVSTFIKKEYKKLDVKDKVVVDIGANIGDSSIYFSLNGARKVFAVEPDREVYQIAEKNIRTNGFSENIELFWGACTAGTGKKDNNTTIPLVTLREIVDKLKINQDALKMDCEGCEYDTILTTPCNVLLKFSHMQIEYHYGYKNLKEKLEKCGFRITLTEPKFFITPFEHGATTKYVEPGNVKRINKTYSGMIFAEK